MLRRAEIGLSAEDTSGFSASSLGFTVDHRSTVESSTEWRPISDCAASRFESDLPGLTRWFTRRRVLEC